MAIPHAVLESDAYRGLSHAATKLLVDITGQFHGANNGDLVACMSVLRPMGWRSSATLNRCVQELIDAGLIQRTRQGGMNAGPNLYAVTWLGIDDCRNKNGSNKLDVSQSAKPSGLWKKKSQ